MFPHTSTATERTRGRKRLEWHFSSPPPAGTAYFHTCPTPTVASPGLTSSDTANFLSPNSAIHGSDREIGHAGGSYSIQVIVLGQISRAKRTTAEALWRIWGYGLPLQPVPDKVLSFTIYVKPLQQCNAGTSGAWSGTRETRGLVHFTPFKVLLCLQSVNETSDATKIAE